MSVPSIFLSIKEPYNSQIRLLPQRSGSKALDHALTSFNHVRLPSWACLGSTSKSHHIRLDFHARIWRVGVGTLALSFLNIPAMSVSAFITGVYSMRRQVTSSTGEKVPIMSFRTQQLPILRAISKQHVMQALRNVIIRSWNSSEAVDPRVRHGLLTALKAVMNQHAQESLVELAERCGAQGLFEHNQIICAQVSDFIAFRNPLLTVLAGSIARGMHC